MSARTPERESQLWLRAGIWMMVAPGLLILLAYLAVPWFDPQLSQGDRVTAAIVVGLGVSLCLRGLFMLGALRLAAGNGGRALRIPLQSVAISSISIGVGLILFTMWKPGSLIRPTGAALMVAGIAVRVAAHLAGALRWFDSRSAK